MYLFSTPPLAIIDYPADEYHMSTNRLDYEVIWIHATAYTGPVGSGDSREWLSKTSNPPVSVHRLGRYGKLYKIVPDHKVAWTQGFTCFDSVHGHDIDPNRVSLSYEIENNNIGEPYSDIDLGLCADQCVEWIGAYGWLPILYHMNCDYRKSDPYGFPREKFWGMLRDRLARYL